jgi:serine-type D-Ala-D-Ala endopeptidase (penicillin-binding protein 7)
LILRAFFLSPTLVKPGEKGTFVASFNKLVTFGLIALVAAFSMSRPVAAATAQASSAKKKAHTSSKFVPTSRVAVRSGKRAVIRHTAMRVRFEPARPSFGQLSGLHQTADSLELKSSVALVLDQETNEILFSKNAEAVLPIASLTKLMTAVVVTEAGLPLDEVLTISQDDVDTEKGSRSRLRVGTHLTREEMLHLALMSSENRAAHSLGRHYPGGMEAFVAAMNRKAIELGMGETHYVEPTGLSSRNQSSARDLAVLVNAAYEHQLIRELSTSVESRFEIGHRQVQFRNTNLLVRNPTWEIGLQKTGYIAEAGRCLVMQTKMAGRQLIMVFLDSAGKYSRIGDAERVRRWITETPAVAPLPVELPKLTS